MPKTAGSSKFSCNQTVFSPSQSMRTGLAIALSHAESKVSRGENSGRRLTHTAVIRRLVKIGPLQPGQSLTRDLQVKLEPGEGPQELRLVAFVQEPGSGRIVGATVQAVGK